MINLPLSVKESERHTSKKKNKKYKLIHTAKENKNMFIQVRMLRTSGKEFC